jgi:uncharacterized protein (DUF1697 family)
MKYIAFLRGINVSGHHKVPMAELRKELTKLGFSNVITLLNSGNVIFESTRVSEESLEQSIAEHLEKVFGFQIPVLIRKTDDISELINNNPFQNIEETKDIRLYISFLKEKTTADITLPWLTEDGSFRILEIRDRSVSSVLNLALSQTTKGMEILEKNFGKNITTRNWNTLNRIADKF